MTEQTPSVLLLSPQDDVAVALMNLKVGNHLTSFSTIVLNEVPRGHKIALHSIAKGRPVQKYGHVIGRATQDIAAGAHVHVHNMDANAQTGRVQDVQPANPAPRPAGLSTSFKGYKRSSGLVGTRNYIAILSTVNCSATVSRRVADHFNNGDVLAPYPNVDGVIALTHGFGCASASGGIGHKMLQRTLVGCAFNPNVGAVVMIGLGCETNQVHLIKERFGLKNDDRLKSFSIQEVGGARAAIERAIACITSMLASVNSAVRVPVPVSELRLALQCGGSDAYSGITANPALGIASDYLVAQGGTAILSETPEIYGAEHILLGRAVNPGVAEKLAERIEWWRNYAIQNAADLDNNPSYGNKLGGLTTIFEKSLGAIAKAGQSPLSAVYEYGEAITEHGLVFVDTPGYDPMCSAGQIASGATVMCFTTGRGSVSGFKPVPTIKLASNSQMYQHMSEDMDINCGTIIEGEMLEKTGGRIYEEIIAVASGKRTASEINGFGDNEFVPWQLGPVF